MQITTGTCTVTNGSPTVVGSLAADWSTATVGSIFVVPFTEGILYTVGAITGPGVSDSGFYELTLTIPYVGATNALAPYAISKDFTPNLGLALLGFGDVESGLLFNRNMTKLDQAVTNAGSGVIPLTRVVGGTEGDLDNVSTLALDDRTTRRVLEFTGGFWVNSEWVLTTATTATDVPSGILRPLDYNGVTNTRVWIKFL